MESESKRAERERERLDIGLDFYKMAEQYLLSNYGETEIFQFLQLLDFKTLH